MAKKQFRMKPVAPKRPRPSTPPPALSPFVALEANDGLLHARPSAIDVVSNPVNRPGGNVDGRADWALYLTLASGQKALILDTPANRRALGIAGGAVAGKAAAAGATLPGTNPAPAVDSDEDDE